MSYYLEPKVARDKHVSRRTRRQDRHRDLSVKIVRPFRRRLDNGRAAA